MEVTQGVLDEEFQKGKVEVQHQIVHQWRLPENYQYETLNLNVPGLVLCLEFGSILQKHLADLHRLRIMQRRISSGVWFIHQIRKARQNFLENSQISGVGGNVRVKIMKKFISIAEVRIQH